LQNDQLNKIFEVIGTPQKEEDYQFIKTEAGIKYLKSFPERERLDLKEKYPGTDDRGIAILTRMLEFNPEKRISAEEALKDSYFDEIRIPENETMEPPEIDLFFDSEDVKEVEIRDILIEELKKNTKEL